jgi:hypothetical protein
MKQILIETAKVLGLVTVIAFIAAWIGCPDDLFIALIAVSSVFAQDLYDGLLFLYRKIHKKIHNIFK